MSVLTIDPSGTPITIACARGGHAAPRKVGERGIGFSGSENNGVRKEFMVVPVVTAPLTSAVVASIRTLFALGAAVACSGDVFNNSSAVVTCSGVITDEWADNTGRWVLSLTLSQVGRGCGFALPTAYDDEFDCLTSVDLTGARFPSANAWTRYKNTINFVSQAQADSKLYLVSSSNGLSFDPRGVYQTLPSGDWTFRSSFDMDVGQWDEGVGMYVTDNTDYLYLNLGANFGNFASVRRRGGATTQYGTVSGLTTFAAWGEISRVGATLTFRYSQDWGGTWHTLYTALQTVDFATAPTLIGLHVANQVVNVNNTARFDWFYRIA